MFDGRAVIRGTRLGSRRLMLRRMGSSRKARAVCVLMSAFSAKCYASAEVVLGSGVACGFMLTVSAASIAGFTALAILALPVAVAVA